MVWGSEKSSQNFLAEDEVPLHRFIHSRQNLLVNNNDKNIEFSRYYGKATSNGIYQKNIRKGKNREFSTQCQGYCTLDKTLMLIITTKMWNFHVIMATLHATPAPGGSWDGQRRRSCIKCDACTKSAVEVVQVETERKRAAWYFRVLPVSMFQVLRFLSLQREKRNAERCIRNPTQTDALLTSRWSICEEIISRLCSWIKGKLWFIFVWNTEVFGTGNQCFGHNKNGTSFRIIHVFSSRSKHDVSCSVACFGTYLSKAISKIRHSSNLRTLLVPFYFIFTCPSTFKS